MIRETAVRKASKARLLADMRRAAQVVGSDLLAMAQERNGAAPSQTRWSRGYVWGVASVSSATLRACLMTAWGC